MPALDYEENGADLDFNVTVEAPDLCPRYIAHYVSDVAIGQSPAWMRRRLALVGVNSISNMVDITNYVLKEFGQPMHAFDMADLENFKKKTEAKERYMTIGMSADLAKEAAEAEVNGDMDALTEVYKRYNEASIKANKDEWLRTRPEPAASRDEAGNEDPFLKGFNAN